ncbi:MAG: histidine kinase, partial [Sphingomonas bacterium]
MLSPTALAAGFVARWPTGARLFLILSIALLPLAVIAAYATLQTTHNADKEASAGLRLASTESGRAMVIELLGDMSALRRAVESLALDPHDAPGCARAQGVFSQQSGIGAQFVIFDRGGRVRCGTAFAGARRIAMSARGDAIRAR